MRLSILFGIIGILTAVGVGFLAQADQDVCSAGVKNNPVQMRALTFLSTAVGQHPLGSCTYELHVCQSFAAPGDDRGTIVGDVLVIDQDGKQFYVPLDFGGNELHHTSVKIVNGHRVFHYEYNDAHDDPVAGRLQSFRLEIVKDENRVAVTHIEVGEYTTNEARLKDSREYEWAICDGGAVTSSVTSAVTK